jgi:peptide-methionine (S)-S-oxide reductase
MSASDGAPRALPPNPSAEHLRKQAKRLAKSQTLQLAAAQHKLAAEYGFPDWASLMREVHARRPEPPPSALAEAALAGDVGLVVQLLADGHSANDGGSDQPGPLWQACKSKAPDADRLAIAEALLKAGAYARGFIPGGRALHIAAARGPVALAELLIRHGAIEWEPDAKGRSALDVARRGRAPDKAALVELLDRPVIRDPSFRAGVDAIQSGDVAMLSRLLDAEPRLVVQRIREPDCYRDSGRRQYFLDPKLFWFIAYNPIPRKPMPANMADIAAMMIARGVEQADLDYTLGLVMTGSSAREHGLQIPLVKLLIEAGAIAKSEGMGGILAHGEIAVVEYLVDAGMEMNAPIAAGLGRTGALASLLRGASQTVKDQTLDLAVINNRTEAVRICLEAGANPDRFMSQHSHGQPLHNAALHENIEVMEMLIAHGAGLDVMDKLWGGTPLGWAKHEGKKASEAFLEKKAQG